MFFKIATDRHSCQQTNALKQLKNDIGFVGLVRRTASKLFKVKNRELDPATPCVRGWPWYHTWWWVKGIWSVLTHEHDTQGPSWGYSVLCQFWLFLIYWLSYACAMTEIMSRAKLHVYLLRKKEISKSFMLHQLPRWGVGGCAREGRGARPKRLEGGPAISLAVPAHLYRWNSSLYEYKALKIPASRLRTPALGPKSQPLGTGIISVEVSLP